MLSNLVLHQKLNIPEIEQRRAEVALRLMKESAALRDINFSTINTRDLFELFCNYDELFFDGKISAVFENEHHSLKFRLSSRMTSTGGMTTYHKIADQKAGRRRGSVKRQFEIAVSSTLLFNTRFRDRTVKVGGLETVHRLDALQRIFEHELVHLLEMVLWDDSSCARQRFKGIVKRIFGHVESNHQLLTPADTARSDFGIATGDRVQFHYGGHCLTGIVNGINRRATVLVPDRTEGEWFDDNRRYRRYYVPLERLSRVPK